MSYFLKLLHLRRNEVPRLGLASALFFLVQVDDGIVKSVAAAVFNIRAGVENLPLMYTWIAVVFSLSMVLLSWLTAKVARQRLLFAMMGGVALVYAVNAGALLLDSSGQLALGADYYSFLFISSELGRTLMNFQIWIVAGGICYVSRAKVFFPLLASSAVLGDISGGFLVRILGSLLHSYQLYGLATLNMVLVLILLRQLMRRYFVAAQGDEIAAEAAGLGENAHYFARSYYLLLLFGLSLAIFSVYTAVHYGFNVVAYDYYGAGPDSEAKITEFFGLFFGLTGLATLFVTTFLLQRLLRWVGTGNIYLWVGVVYVLIALLLLSVFSGGFADMLGLGWIAAIALLPLVAIFAGNLVNYLLLDSVVAPTYQVLAKLIPARNSDGTRMIMEGGFMLLGGLVGAGITSLHANRFLSMGELFALLLAFGCGMVLCGYLLKRSYTTELVKAVREQNIDVEDDQAMQALKGLLANDPSFSRELLLHRNDGVRQMGIEMLRQYPGPAVEQVCMELFDHDNPRIRAAALEAFTPGSAGANACGAVLSRLDDEDEETLLKAVQTLTRFTEQVVLDNTAKMAIRAAVAQRLCAAGAQAALKAECLVLLAKLDDGESAEQRGLILVQLLTDENTDALIAGIGAAGRMEAEQAQDRLLECLEHPHPAVREATVHSLGALGKDQGLAALIELLGDPDPDVVAAAVVTLGQAEGVRQQMVDELMWRPLKVWGGLLGALIAQDDEELNEALVASCRERLILASRYLVAIDRLERTGDSAVQLVVDQLALQNGLVQDGVVRLLGYLGDVGVVGDLMERLSADDEAARESAVELLENIADRELLTQLMPLIESDRETQLTLAHEVSGWGEGGIDEVLYYLIHSPNVWTEMATIWAAFALGREEVVTSAAAELQSEAREVMVEIERKRGEGEMAEEQPLTTMEKITFLKESPFFAALPLEELYHIALSMEEEGAREGTVVIREGTMGDKMYIVISGDLEVKKESGPRFAVLGEKQVFGEQALLDEEPRSASVVALGDVHLLSLQRSSLERILRRYSSIAFNMMRILSHRLREAQAS